MKWLVTPLVIKKEHEDTIMQKYPSNGKRNDTPVVKCGYMYYINKDGKPCGIPVFFEREDK